MPGKSLPIKSRRGLSKIAPRIPRARETPSSGSRAGSRVNWTLNVPVGASTPSPWPSVVTVAPLAMNASVVFSSSTAPREPPTALPLLALTTPVTTCTLLWSSDVTTTLPLATTTAPSPIDVRVTGLTAYSAAAPPPPRLSSDNSPTGIPAVTSSVADSDDRSSSDRARTSTLRLAETVPETDASVSLLMEALSAPTPRPATRLADSAPASPLSVVWSAARTTTSWPALVSVSPTGN